MVQRGGVGGWGGGGVGGGGGGRGGGGEEGGRGGGREREGGGGEGGGGGGGGGGDGTSTSITRGEDGPDAGFLPSSSSSDTSTNPSPYLGGRGEGEQPSKVEALSDLLMLDVATETGNVFKGVGLTALSGLKSLSKTSRALIGLSPKKNPLASEGAYEAPPQAGSSI